MARYPGALTCRRITTACWCSYGGESQEYYFGGNPVVQDETYLTARNAFNNQNGDTISRLVYAQIRNCREW